MMSQKKISVIIPVYNGAKYVGEAIQSVLDQTYENFEIIVVNDASTDHSSDVIHSYNDPRIKIISHDVNRGSNVTRNTGVRASSGDNIAYLDQDDLYHPEKLQAHVNLLEANPEVGFSYNSRFEFHNGSTVIGKLWRPPQILTLKDCVLGYPLSPTDMVIKREWLFRVGFLS